MNISKKMGQIQSISRLMQKSFHAILMITRESNHIINVTQSHSILKKLDFSFLYLVLDSMI